MFEKYGYLAIPLWTTRSAWSVSSMIDDAISIMQDEASEDIAKMNAMGPSDKPILNSLCGNCTKAVRRGCCS